jgi:hypothetical protein
MLESRFSLTPQGNEGAYPKPSGDLWGSTILGYNSVPHQETRPTRSTYSIFLG